MAWTVNPITGALTPSGNPARRTLDKTEAQRLAMGSPGIDTKVQVTDRGNRLDMFTGPDTDALAAVLVRASDDSVLVSTLVPGSETSYGSPDFGLNASHGAWLLDNYGAQYIGAVAGEGKPWESTFVLTRGDVAIADLFQSGAGSYQLQTYSANSRAKWFRDGDETTGSIVYNESDECWEIWDDQTDPGTPVLIWYSSGDTKEAVRPDLVASGDWVKDLEDGAEDYPATPSLTFTPAEDGLIDATGITLERNAAGNNANWTVLKNRMLLYVDNSSGSSVVVNGVTVGNGTGHVAVGYVDPLEISCTAPFGIYRANVAADNGSAGADDGLQQIFGYSLNIYNGNYIPFPLPVPVRGNGILYIQAED